MKKQEIILSDSKTITVIQAKVSQNSKIGLGYIVQTYHFSIEQIASTAPTINSSSVACEFGRFHF